MGAWGLLFSSFLIGFSGAVMPGPVLAMTISHTARMGAVAGPLMVLGHGILELPLVVGLVLGLGAFLTTPWVMAFIGAVGGLMLLYMGQDMLRSLPGLSLDISGAEAGGSGPVRDGVVLSLVNPYFILWWATVGLSLVMLSMESGLGWWGLAVFYAGHISADLVWYFFVSLVIAKGRRFVSDGAYRWVVGACAVMLIGFALYFGYFAYIQMAGAA